MLHDCFFTTVLTLLCFCISFCESAGKVRLTDVTTLTLYRGKYTTGRRTAPIPQIQCVGGSAKGLYEPKVVQCYNRGYDGLDVQWECKADMSSEFEFGEISISCEGYDYPEDPYVLQGSCGLKYNLEYSEIGSDYTKYSKNKKVPSAPPYKKDHEFGFSTLVTIAIVLFFAYIVYTTCSSSSDSDRIRRSGWGWDQGPPPPPGSGGPPPPGFKNFNRPFDAPPTYDESCRGTSSQQSQSSGPGFFSGLGLGGLAGYMYGRSQNSEGTFFRGRRHYGNDYGFSDFSSSHHRDDSPRASTSRTASGFGGTERR